ncbi:PREDICTED: translation initiation factor IF-2-like isoform X1 [Rhinopithecus bieti]|uniref:translation initiation factor IF-2-like isoform X1 n=1 Tax=Rhinopithecus bieti TaxID=61621 RepID=UPI00083C1D4E|nr:PREDICTED: translation initiation factor IF-2-like isoform X1 [Rhinopithecus bieti]
MPTFSGQLRSRLSPLLPPRRRPLQSPPGRSARRQRRASVAFPSPPPGPPLQASPELSVAQTSPPGPARPSPRAPQTLSNPLGSRRLLGEETLAAAEAGATRLRAGRRRGARYGEPSNEARAGAQRRRVLAEHGRGAAAAAVAAGAQGPLHHWQPWSPSIFLPQGRRLGSAHVLGEEGAGARASLEGGGTCARAEGATLSCPLPPQPALPHPAAPATGREGAAAAAPFSAALVARRAGAATAADAVQRNERLKAIRDFEIIVRQPSIKGSLEQLQLACTPGEWGEPWKFAPFAWERSLGFQPGLSCSGVEPGIQSVMAETS